jgi:nucleotide-binding universal stress UspA family protein
MYPPKKILFPIDFSQRSAAIAPMVRDFVRQFHAAPTLLHVLPEDATDEQRIEAQEDLNVFADSHFQGMSVCRGLLQGDPRKEIIGFAHEHIIDLIMMPTHGYGPFRRLLLGSVALNVLRDAWCPVWTDAHTEVPLSHQNAKFRNILCAVDLSQRSHPALHWAKQFAADTQSRLTIVHATPLALAAGVGAPIPDWRPELDDAAREEIARLQQSEGTHAAVTIVAGEVAHAVRAAAEEVEADLLVIGRGAENGHLGRLRNHAYPIIRHSPCPVVSV